MSDTDDLVDALFPVVAALCELEILHFVCGSIASSYHGATRSTMDVDLVCEWTPEKIEPFVKQFDDSFYLSEAAIRDAVRRRSCFNLIHLPSSFKVDIFVSRERPFDREAMQRATLACLGESRKVEVRIATAEGPSVCRAPVVPEWECRVVLGGYNQSARDLRCRFDRLNMNTKSCDLFNPRSGGPARTTLLPRKSGWTSAATTAPPAIYAIGSIGETSRNIAIVCDLTMKRGDRRTR